MPDENTIALQALEDSLAKGSLSPKCRAILEKRRDMIKKRMINGRASGKKSELVRRLKIAREVRSRSLQQHRAEMLELIDQMRDKGLQWSKISLRLAKKGYLAHGGMQYTVRGLMNFYGRQKRG